MKTPHRTLVSTRMLAASAGLLLAVVGSAHAQWSSKPPPPLPLSVLDQGWQGAVTVRLVLNSDGSVKQASVVRSSGISALDELARLGTSRWRLELSNLRPSDLTQGREQIIKFYQPGRVKQHVPPVIASWVERRNW